MDQAVVQDENEQGQDASQMCDEGQDGSDGGKKTGRGVLLIISGPSGVGKTTITHHVEKELGASFSVSMTTREKTHADVEGRDYYFIGESAFLKAKEAGELLECAEVFGNWYGTPREPVEKMLNEGKAVILEIDVEGAAQVKENMADAFAVFVLPPSEEELLRRLKSRQRESEDVIMRRFAKSKAEIARAKECGIYDVFLTNDILEETVVEAARVIKAEIQRRQG
ncbi:guanylate kinase [Poriferisphaera sp. WC338]|uniref:guanylate kinase n=1 Tax=Poriferisphaera sp. WC338 TaxID=3425129 RepID=UPI003D812635